MFNKLYFLFRFIFLFGFSYIMQFIDKYIFNLTPNNMQIKYINQLIESIMKSNNIIFSDNAIEYELEKNEHIRVFECNNKKYIIKYNKIKRNIIKNAFDAALQDYIIRECEFYNITNIISIPIKIPKIIFSEYNGFLWKYVCIFEYIEDYKTVKGSKCIGFHNAKKCINIMATLHNKYLQDIQSLTKYNWLINSNTKNGNIIDWIQLFNNKHDKDFLNLINILSKYINKIPSTLIHGDFRSGNMLFKENEDPYLLDWQMPMYGLNWYDLAYFILLSLDNETRKKYENDLIKIYSDQIKIYSDQNKIYSDQNIYNRNANEDYIISKLVVLCLYYHFSIIEYFQGWGSDKEDSYIWHERFVSACDELDILKIANILDCSEILIRKNINLIKTNFNNLLIN
jgi:thiamine kinase-like enzyme